MENPGDFPPGPPGETHLLAQPAAGGTPGGAIPVVGIGASAGGLDVFKRLLTELPVDTGLAVVFVQHLEPSHQSMLAQILSRCTAIPVSDAEDGVPVEADHVYVIPANVDLTIANGTLRLSARTQAPGSHMPIDGFLRSLALDCGNGAIAVILSGTGADGAAGVEAVKAAGGLTFAQDEASARFAMMPQAAIATGCVDFVLPPEQIAAELARVSRHKYITGSSRARLESPQGGDEAGFDRILAALKAASGIDFSLYREKMVRRRILRRLALRNISNLDEYRERLKQDPAELIALQRDLLIGVTSFFRDLDSFESLKTIVFPLLCQDRRADDPVRIWVAGCASGEEAYSIAILLHEYFLETGTAFPVQIFASDISTEAIAKARAGKYPDSVAADMTQERLDRNFTSVEGGFRVNKELREMCVFTRHNLLDDPPFSKLDLISCRNVLIYLGGVQRDLLPVFHYALKPSGFLLLGSSEAAATGDLFTVADGDHRIFARRATTLRSHPFPVGIPGVRRMTPGGRPPGASATGSWTATELRQEVDRVLLSRYSPAGVVVDQDLEVLEIRGRTSPFLSLPAGKVSFNLIKLIPDTSLFLEVEKLIQEALATGEPARREHLRFEHHGVATDLTVEVLPLESERRRSTLVLFEPAAESLPHGGQLEESSPDSQARDRQILRLQQQLAEAKERFLSAIETYQSTREEIQTTTEEALSANEELQSLNEELETAKEELQSTNEELITVNDELQAKNLALAQARDFAMSIVETVRQPLLVLDTDLHIKMANQAFYRTFQLSPQEAEGHSLYSLAGGSWDLPVVRNSLGSLLRSSTPFIDLELEQEFPRAGRRSLVLGGCCISHIGLILLAVDDVTERKLVQLALSNAEEHLRQSQKMEAVGRLAGGIAHDFNNLLTTIIGYSELLKGSLAGQEGLVQQVSEIRSAGDRAAALTQQLLSFSRRQVLQPKILDLNLIVRDFDRMLRRLVGEDIQVRMLCDTNLRHVRADPGEIGRAVMNLALNARDAMPDGGTLTIETANILLSEAEATRHFLPAGPYVALTVHDTGVGFDSDVRAHIFEPFFTTKATGKGTGLGLATVQGIVEQSGGAIHCESELGVKTTFTILLPAVASQVESGSTPVLSLSSAPQGSETILLVEDEEMVRVLARKVLESLGYVIFEAGNGVQGLEFCRAHEGHIDLLVTDVVMPELGGRELAEGAILLWPHLKVLFLSGHTQDVILKAGVQKGAAFLQKPFSPISLAQKVRLVLDSGTRAVGR
ncbi:chemotaxis protein CheB [Paludibaculum fermentans]|uniref:chemotaxis protein CheB n=1 Tax=Paludibaculum fermentans TaxID=1473598 RepID=UPI003EBF6D6F